MARDRGAKEDKKGEKKEEKKINLDIGEEKEKKEVKSISDMAESVDLELTVPESGQAKLTEIKKMGVKSSFLKLVFGGDYQEFYGTESVINDKLFEYPVTEVKLDESGFIVKCNIYIADPEDFLVKTIGIYLIDESLLDDKVYKEVLLGFNSQKKFFDFQGAKKIDLILTIKK